MIKELPKLKSQMGNDITPIIPKDRLPFVKPIDESGYGIKRKGYQIGTEHNNLSGGYRKYMDDVTPFLNIHSEDANISDFNKKIKTPFGGILVNGDRENNNINISYGLDRPFNEIPNATYNATYKLYALYNALKAKTLQYNENRPKDVLEIFPIYPKILK